TVDGEPAEVDAAVRRCAEAGGGAELVATGDAVYGDLQALRVALDRAGVSVLVREPAATARDAAPAGGDEAASGGEPPAAERDEPPAGAGGGEPGGDRPAAAGEVPAPAAP
ncbi:MAG TPA: hypothetical protein VKZ63_11730, partial [Kofleriaceae bacterium]|nr:hypothetical protein [Kofleriaceae bacterium]